MTVPEPPAEAPSRGLTRPALAVTALVLAVLFVPFHLASAWPGGGYPDRTALVDSLTSGLRHQWVSGTSVVGPALARPVAFWERFHVVKAVLAAVLLVAAVLLASRTRLAHSRAAGPRRWLLLAALVLVEVPLLLLAMLVVVANLQGAVAPLSSALGLLPLAAPDARLAEVVAQARHGLSAGTQSSALGLLVHDFTRYHLAMGGLGALVTAVAGVAAVVVWRRGVRMPSGPRRGRLLTATLVAAAVATAAFFAVVTAANVSTVAHPEPALLAFLAGGG